MLGEKFSGFFNRLDNRLAELFVLKMRAHGIDQPLPELVAAFFVNAAVSDDGELARPRDQENQDAVSFQRLVHANLLKFLLRKREGIAFQLAALKVNADLSRCFRFRFFDRSNDPIVIEMAEKSVCSHFYQLDPAPPPPKLPPPPPKPENPPPDEPEDQPPPPDHPPINGPPNPE